jgi:hypothetical protein
VITHTHLPFLNQDNKRSGGHERITHSQALLDIPRNNVDFFMLVLQAAQGIGGRLSLHYKLMQMKKHRRIKMRKETWRRKGMKIPQQNRLLKSSFLFWAKKNNKTQPRQAWPRRGQAPGTGLPCRARPRHAGAGTPSPRPGRAGPSWLNRRCGLGQCSTLGRSPLGGSAATAGGGAAHFPLGRHAEEPKGTFSLPFAYCKHQATNREATS